MKNHLLTRPEAAAYLGVSVSTLARWACLREKLPYHRVGRRALYRLNALDDYLDRVAVQPIDWGEQIMLVLDELKHPSAKRVLRRICELEPHAVILKQNDDGETSRWLFIHRRQWADQLVVPTRTISRSLETLEKLGFIERQSTASTFVSIREHGSPGTRF